MYLYIGSLSGYPSCDLFSLRSVCRAGTSRSQCFLPDRPGHFLNKSSRIYVISSQTVLWPPVSPASILICIQLPDGFFYTILSYDFFNPQTSCDFSFSQDSNILVFDVFPYLASTIFSKLTLCGTSSHLTHSSALTGFAQACFCAWSPSILFSAPENLWCQSESQQEAGQWHSKAIANEGTLYRGVVSVWESQQGRSVTPSTCSARGENRLHGRGAAWEELWPGTSLVVQWLQIRLPTQGTRVRALVQEDTMCRGATKPVHHNYWACTLEPASHNYWGRVPQLLKPACLEPVLRNKRSHCNEKPVHHNEE